MGGGEWAIEDLLKPGDTMVLASPPKEGKSLAVLDLAVSMVINGTWFGYQCSGARGFDEDEYSRDVLLLNLENPADDQSMRLESALSARGLTRDALGDHLQVLNLKNSTASWDLEALSDEVYQLTKRTGFDVFDCIIIDPIYALIDGDESSNRAMAQFFTQLAEFRDEFGGSLVLTHHFIKAWRSIKDGHADRIAGAGTISRSPEVIATLTPRGRGRVELNITARRHDCSDVRGRVYRAEGPRFVECDADEQPDSPVDPFEGPTRAAIARLALTGPVKIQDLADELGKHHATTRERVRKYGFVVKKGVVIPIVGGDVPPTTNKPPTNTTLPDLAGVGGDGGGPPKGDHTTNHHDTAPDRPTRLSARTKRSER